MKQPEAGKAPLYYGWYIVFTCLFIALVTAGAVSYTHLTLPTKA